MRLVRNAVRVLREEGAGVLLRRTHSLATRSACEALARRTVHLGSGRECPLCGFVGRTFLPAGQPVRPEARCPECRALERHRLLWLFLERHLDRFDHEIDVLYLAPMDRLADRLSTRANVVTADLLMDTVDVNADVTRLPFADDAFDLVLCVHVLEHVPDDHAALVELHRVLRPSGEAIVMVPQDPERTTTYEDDTIVTPQARVRAFGQADHVRWYGADFHDRLEAAGFGVVVDRGAAALTAELATRCGLLVHDTRFGVVRDEVMFRCAIPVSPFSPVQVS